MLFQADLRDRDPSRVLAAITVDPDASRLLDDDDQQGVEGGDAVDVEGGDRVDEGADDYARHLVDGVATSRHRLDEVIGRYSHHWEVERMPIVDRNILRLATWELLHEELAPAVVINEALELAKELSTEHSHRFVNGVLEAVRQDRDRLLAGDD